MADAVAVAPTLDSTAVKVFLTAHPSGLFALCAPRTPAEGEELSADAVGQVVRLLAKDLAYLVIDTGAGLDEPTLAAVELSTDLVFVGAMDVPSVRSLHLEIEALDALGMRGQRRHFVLNRADSRVGLRPEDIEAAIGLKVHVSLPSSRAVPISVNQGSPVLESEPRAPIARGFLDLVYRFTEEPARRDDTRRRWGRDQR
jgi:pilus assembly protein CpaE